MHKKNTRDPKMFINILVLIASAAATMAQLKKKCKP